MDSFCANSRTDLIKRLASENIKVPPMGTGRRTKQVERWSMFRLLSTFSNSAILNYPIFVVHKDKPDFRLHFEETTIGVELTEALPENYARALAYVNTKMPDAMIELSYFGWSAPRMSNAEIKKILSKNRLVGPPSFENTQKWQWCQAMKSCISHKTNALNSIEFKRYNENWLVIYDNIPDTPTIDSTLNGLLSFVESYRSDHSAFKVKFDGIFIESQKQFIFIREQSERKKIVDLWEEVNI